MAANNTHTEQENFNQASGTNESRFLEGALEVDLHLHYNDCEKNPGHEKFVLVSELNRNDLPEGFVEDIYEDIFQLIKVIADLTVKVSVTMISPDRPEFIPDTDIPYIGYEDRGRSATYNGTGFVNYVIPVPIFGEPLDKTCPCTKCQNSSTPSTQWMELKVKTARHMVFDDFEAKHTTCIFDFDGQGSELVCLNDWTMTSKDDDESILFYVTCDKELKEKLVFKLDECMVNLILLSSKFACSYEHEKDIIFIVSHPHGCAKYVTTGEIISKIDMGDDWRSYKYTYSASTCEGCSGAYIHRLRLPFDLCHSYPIHIGATHDNVNISGIGRSLMSTDSYVTINGVIFPL